MSDIVERLRDGSLPAGHEIRIEAATEIEQLRAKLEVSEAVNRAKTELIVEIETLIKQQTGPPISTLPNQDVRDMIARLNENG